MSSRKLKRLGLSPQVVKAFERHRVTTVKELLRLPRIDLVEMGVPLWDVLAARAAASRAVLPRPMTALALSQEQGRMLATSLPTLDRGLHGGLAVGMITEVTGPSGCGKTQFCVMMSVQATLPRARGGLDGGVVYVDTEDAFSAQRLVEVARARYPDLYSSTEALLGIADRIHVLVESSCSSFMATLERMEEILIETGARLLVVDSIASLVRKEFDSRNTVDRTDLLHREATVLKHLAETFRIPVLVTNQITTRSTGDVSVVTAALGNTWAHSVNTRLVVEYTTQGPETRLMTVAKSPICPAAALQYEIGDEGVNELSEVACDHATAAKSLLVRTDLLAAHGLAEAQHTQVLGRF